MQAINSSEFFNKEYLAAFGIAQASLALLLLARYFFFEEVFSPWHSKQVSSAHDLAKTFLNFFDFRENGRYCCYRMCKTAYSPADLADSRRQNANYINSGCVTTVFF
ncbi:hypothetical protein [Prevotella sp.]|uniref:hypothetical protein n=1 Tax=Prevotella sp. TaxID=59823 RepID=UPI0026477B0F|nr:hypothetical protein [Prevotella sp.]MDN5554343.1 hypothetical protein [Prevotella sp.]